MDKIYLSTPTKIAILDHEKKRTFVVRKDGLPDAGKTTLLAYFRLLCCVVVMLKMLRVNVTKITASFHDRNRKKVM